MKTERFIPFLFLLSLAAHARAAVVLELDASALPVGEISETQNAIPGGRWQPNVPLRVEHVAGRQAFVFDGTQTLISGLLLAEKWDAFTVEAWAAPVASSIGRASMSARMPTTLPDFWPRPRMTPTTPVLPMPATTSSQPNAVSLSATTPAVRWTS